MANTLQKNLETANLTDSNKDLFIQKDLTAFTDLMKSKEDFDEMIKGFENETTMKEIQAVKGLKESIDTFIKTKTGLADIFSKEYNPDPLTKDQDLYEVCVLGAILDQTKKIDKPDYKVLAKAYYDKINPVKVDAKVETKVIPTITGNYNTGSAEIADTGTTTKIETATKIEAGKNITEASITISAGADQRKMTLESATNDRKAKIIELTTLKDKFTSANNKAAIDGVIKELSTTNIESKIIDTKTTSKINPEQNGNRYLIAARIAEGFINVLNKLTITPEPKLTKLSVDRASCEIGNTNADVPTDRDITIGLDVKMETSTTVQTINPSTAVNNAATGGTGTTAPITGAGNTNPVTGTGTTAPIIGAGTGASAPVTNGSGNTGSGSGHGPNPGNYVPNNIGTPNTVTIAPIETPVDNVETAEIISLKKEIYEHFTLNGKAISREIDISNTIVYKNGIYTVAIKGYSGLEFVYNATKKTIEVKASTAGARKGLFLYDVTNQSVATDKTDKKDIIPTFNNAKTIEALNKQLETNDKDADKKADYKVKTITGSSIDFEYGVSFVKDKTDETKTKTDKFTIQLDAENNIITPDSQQAGQISQWKKIEGAITKDTDFVFDDKHKTESGKKVVYYMQTKVNDNGIAELSVMNNIQESITSGYESIYTEHKEMTNPEFKEIKEDFLANKIERIFVGTLKDSHNTDFQNNRKISKVAGSKKGEYNFEITFNKNDGKQQKVNMPFTMTIDNATNTRKYIFTNKQKKSVSIDNISYTINTPTSADGVPSIKMIENQEETLKNAEKGTSKKLFSDIFSGEKTNRGSDNNKYEVKSPAFSLGNIEFVDGKGGYKRTIFFGEQKDANGNILLAGEEKGTVYYDQDYKIISVKIKTDGQEKEIDFSDKDAQINMENVLEDEDAANKGVILTPGITTKDKTSSVQLNFKTPIEKDKNWQTSDLYMERIREEKETIFTALKQLSKTLTGNVFMLPSIKNADETSYKTSKMIGPDGRGLYSRKLANVYEKGSNKYLEQNIYCKVEGTGLQLCDNDGNKMDKIYVIDYEKGDYYELNVDDSDSKNFSVKKLDNVDLQDVAKIQTEEVEYTNGKVAIDLKSENIELLKSNFKDSYTFSNKKHEMCTIKLDSDKKLDEAALETGAAKKPQIIEANNVLFGSYKKYFAGDGRENLGIGEADYETTFKSIYENYSSKDTNKKIIQVKLRSSTDKKYYYDYMAIKQKGKNNFSLEKLDGLEEAKAEMKRRLDNLVLLDKIQASTKGDKLRGVKINNKDNTSRLAYLKDKTSPVKITLTDTTSKTSDQIEITMKDNQKRVLANNKNLSLGEQKINCELQFKDDIPFLKMEVIEQVNEKQ